MKKTRKKLTCSIIILVLSPLSADAGLILFGIGFAPEFGFVKIVISQFYHNIFVRQKLDNVLMNEVH